MLLATLVAPVGSETLVNSTTEGSQQFSSNNNGNIHTVAMDANGNYVVAWQGNGPGDADGIFAQRFSAVGAQVGTEFLVNTATSGAQTDGMVAMDSGGSFVVAWGSGGLVYAQLFQADGTPRGSQFQVTSRSESRVLAVDMDTDGDFVVLYGSPGRLRGPDIYAQRFNALGQAQGNATKVASTTLIAGTADVAMDTNGNFAVAWADAPQRDPNGLQVFAQRYTRLGKAQGELIKIQSPTGPRYPSIAMDEGGSFAINWHDDSGGHAQLFNADGTKRGGVFSHPDADAFRSAIAIEPDGDTLVITWQTSPDANSEVQAQRFSALAASAGQPLEDPFLVNTTIDGTQNLPSVALRSDGSFVIVWSGNGPGDDAGVFAQRFESSTDTSASSLTLESSTAGTEDAEVVFLSTDSDSGGTEMTEPAIPESRHRSASVPVAAPVPVNLSSVISPSLGTTQQSSANRRASQEAFADYDDALLDAILQGGLFGSL